MLPICGWGMDGDDTEREASMEDVDLNSHDQQFIDSAKQQLALQCDGYLVYLEKIFGCGLCRGVNAVFNAKVYDHTEIRKKQLKHLKTILTTNSTESPKYFRRYLLALDFKGTMGQSFRQSCLNVLRLHIPDLSDDEDPECIICMEKSRSVVALPCAHYQSCERCFKQMLITSKKCSGCRSNIEGYRLLPKGVAKCALCQVNVANMLTRSCGHIATCDSCLGQKSKGDCPICFLKDQSLIKVFY